MKKCIALAALLLTSVTTIAQEMAVPFRDVFPDTLVISDKLKAHLDSIASVYDEDYDPSFDNISDNPLYFRLFMPLVLYGSAVSEAMTPATKSTKAVVQDDLLPLEPMGNESDETLSRMINEALVRVYLEHPELVKMTEAELRNVPGIIPITDDMAMGIRPDDVKAGRRGVSDDSAPEMARVKISHWKTRGNVQGKYTQSFYSENWYRGGESNHSILGQFIFDADYANGPLVFDNKLEMKLGYYTTEIEGRNTLRTNEDLIRFTSKLGLKAWESWYFSSQFQGYTQFMPVYDTKVTSKLKSKFFAPAYGNISAGMDYKPKLKRKNSSLSVLVSPFSYNCRYVSVDSIAVNYGIDPGKNFKYTIGSRFDCNFKWPFLEDFTWTSKTQFYTSYESTEVNLENTVDYRLSRYLSLQFFLHWRYDDSVQRKKDKDGKLMSYSQFKEFITLNFNYTW